MNDGMHDPRLITGGHTIPSIHYCDQPYVVRTDDGAWLCIMTTGAGHEGQPGQTVIAVRSTDRGATWSEPVFLEPTDGPEASYAVLLKAPTGRVFAFYNHNTDNVRWVTGDTTGWPDGRCKRVDSLGHFVFRYSDDGGRTWSPQRYEVPQRLMAIDRENADGGKLLYFWNVGRAFAHAGTAYVPLHKVGGFGVGFFTRSEGVLLASDDLLTAMDPAKATWQTLPDGDIGLRTPAGGGPIAEEQSFVVLSDGSFFCVYRTIDGHPVCACSRDHGHTWSAPRYLTYADGRRIKHPRAANFIWPCGQGRYLYWFHNHGGRQIVEHPRRADVAYQGRNPVWLAGAVEVEGPDGLELRFSQPDVALYDDDVNVRMSYPDLVIEDGRYYVTETQKTVARVHELSTDLVEGLWRSLETPVTRPLGPTGSASVGRRSPNASPLPPCATGRECARPPEGLVADVTGGGSAPPPNLPAFHRREWWEPQLPANSPSAGFTLELDLDFVDDPGRIYVDHRNARGEGFCVRATGAGTLELVMRDDWTVCAWDTDPGALQPGRRHRVTIIVDGGPHLILFLVDGRLCDGGESRQFGWGRFSPHLRGVSVDAPLAAGAGVHALRVHARALRVSEAMGWHGAR